MSEEGWTATLNAGGVAGRHYAVDPQGNRHTIVFKNRHYYIVLGVLVPNGSVSETFTPRATNFDDRERGTSTLDKKIFLNATTSCESTIQVGSSVSHAGTLCTSELA